MKLYIVAGYAWSEVSKSLLIPFKAIEEEYTVSSDFEVDPCGFLKVCPSPSPEYLNDYYSSEYYQNPHGTYESNYSEEELNHKDIRNTFFERVISESFKVEKSSLCMVDIGCGEGFLLDKFHGQGWNATGLDFSSFGVAKFNNHLLGNLITGDIYASINAFISENRVFDFLNLGNVLEHVLDPRQLLRMLMQIMHEESTILITVPNDFSMLQKFLKEKSIVERNYWVTVPDHLNYFSEKSLLNLLEEIGFQELGSYADFPIEWFLFNSHSNYVDNPLLGKQAHLSRVAIDSLITSNDDFVAVKNFWSALSKIGQGRTISVLCKKGNP
jgi:2-polyprenyl-3-methyl-5-hydroxy-6-metoxy-1,4-benzoquinol methylase